MREEGVYASAEEIVKQKDSVTISQKDKQEDP